jgi:hypothetical protein
MNESEGENKEGKRYQLEDDSKAELLPDVPLKNQQNNHVLRCKN